MNGKLTKGYEGEDKVLSAVNTTIAPRIVQRVRHRAPITERQEVLVVLIRLGSDAERRRVDALLELLGYLQVLQQGHRVFRRFERPQRLGVLHQRVDYRELTHAI